MKVIQKEFIEKTKKNWSEYYHREVTNQEAFEIIQNIKKLVELLKTLNQN